MPQTYRDYPIYEIGIVTYSNALSDSGQIAAQAGDIIQAGPATDGIGLGECANYIWLRVQGWDSLLLDRLMDPITDKSQADPLYVDESEEPETILESRRYCIPYKDLRRVMPSFSQRRAEDSTDIYQPFMMIDEGALPDLGTTDLYAEVSAVEWYPILLADNPQMLADVMAQIDETTRLVLPRTVVDPEFAEAAQDVGYFLITHPPIDPDGLIYDKFTQSYLYA